MTYIFRTNNLCRMLFGTPVDLYAGEGMSQLIESVLGYAVADKYVIAQDPLCGGEKKGKISIYVGDGNSINCDEYCVIGEIERTD